MKSKLKKIVILLILGLVFPIILSNNFNLSNDLPHKVDIPRTSATVDYIIIDALATTNTTSYGNWSWARAQPWCTTGDGTKEYPYIIEDVTIIYPPAIDCLTVRNSRKYFIVRNCTLKDIPVSTFAGIRLNNVTNANIIDNIAYNNTYGIYLVNCYNSTISGNTANNNSLGIYLYFSDNNTVSGNTANDNIDGIYLEESYGNTISGNTANGNSQNGLYSYFCDYNTIAGNTANDNIDGIYLEESYGNTISGNTVCNNTGGDGIYLYFYCDNNIISGNTANYNYYGIYLEQDCTNNTISGNTANDNTNSGIYVFDNCINNALYNNTANNNADNGIYLEYNSDNNIISGNTVNDNVLFIDNSDYNIITGNTVNNHIGDPGIYLFNSDHNTVSGNTANYNGEAIDLQNSHYNNITGNTANNNTYGIYLYNCENNTISGNSVNDNEWGIYLGEDCHYNEISENIIYNNTIGIEIDDYGGVNGNNSIYKNFFLENGIHAVDDGTDNKWNSTAIGNYWDNHTGPDTTPLDGIVDNPYTFIGGSAGSIDYLPIAEDGVPTITISSPGDDDMFGSVAPSFNVRITDDNLDTMWYTLNGGLNNYIFTDNETINPTAWAALLDGPITITFYANDTFYQISSAEVNIIKDTQNPSITVNSPEDDDIFGSSAPSFVVEISDSNLDSMWYSLDGGTTTFLFTVNGTINQTAWSALAEGSVTITFYANDTLGNEASEDVIITKSIPSSPPDDPTMVIVIVVVSIVGGVAVLAGVYIFMKKRALP